MVLRFLPGLLIRSNFSQALNLNKKLDPMKWFDFLTLRPLPPGWWQGPRHLGLQGPLFGLRILLSQLQSCLSWPHWWLLSSPREPCYKNDDVWRCMAILPPKSNMTMEKTMNNYHFKMYLLLNCWCSIGMLVGGYFLIYHDSWSGNEWTLGSSNAARASLKALLSLF